RSSATSTPDLGARLVGRNGLLLALSSVSGCAAGGRALQAVRGLLGQKLVEILPLVDIGGWVWHPAEKLTGLITAAIKGGDTERPGVGGWEPATPRQFRRCGQSIGPVLAHS